MLSIFLSILIKPIMKKRMLKEIQFIANDSFLLTVEATSWRKMLQKLSSLLVIFLSFQLSEQHSHGGPMSRCVTLYPSHAGAVAQTFPSHYEIIPSIKVIGNGQKLTVEIRANVPEKTFSGFMLQARTTDDPFAIDGMFVEVENPGFNFRPCSGPQTTVTNSNNNRHQSLKFEWTAPREFTGTIKFQ